MDIEAFGTDLATFACLRAVALSVNFLFRDEVVGAGSTQDAGATLLLGGTFHKTMRGKTGTPILRESVSCSRWVRLSSGVALGEATTR